MSAHRNRPAAPRFGAADEPPATDRAPRSPLAARGAAPALLVVASRYAPQTGSGATRLVKTVKYLRELGWRPVVLTGEIVGESGECDDVPQDVPVVRASAATADDGLARFEPLIRAAAAVTRPLGRGAAWWYRGLRWRAERWRARLAFPDAGIWRGGAALRIAKRLHAQHHFQAIFSSGMPFSDHLIALAIQRALHRPWVAEFRDPWFEYAHAPQWHSALGREATRRAERAVVARARFVVSVSPAMTQRFRERYPRERAGKFVTVLNGYDPVDFDARPDEIAPLPEVVTGARFVVLHAGSFYVTRRPEPLLRAFARFVAKDESRRSRAALVLAGRLGEFAGTVAEWSRRCPVNSVGTLPYRAALACMKRAAVNVLVLPGGAGTEGDVSTKVFEYLAAGRAVLATVPAGGAAAKFLEHFDGVWRVEPDDDAAIEQALEAAYAQWRAGRLAPTRDAAALTRLTRQHQTERLSRVLGLAAAQRGVRREKGTPLLVGSLEAACRA